MAGIPVVALLLAAIAPATPGMASVTDDTAVLTISASPGSIAAGGTVSVSGSLTLDGAAVSSSPVAITITDATGGYSSQEATTDSSGAWSLPVTVLYNTTVSANAEDVTSNQPSVQIRALATASLKIGATVSHPYLLDPAVVTTAPAGETNLKLQVRPAGSSGWRSWPDTAGVWGKTSGTFAVRAVATSPYLTTGYSAPATVKVGTGKVPAWVRELNKYRALNNAPPVAEDTHLSRGDALHVRYMEKTGDYSHTENPKSRWYTKLGAEAGASSDLFLGEPDPIRGWAEAPYHAMAELSRFATLAGFATDGAYAALWVDSSTSLLNPKGPYYQFPANNKKTALLTYYGAEIPDPLSTCPRAWRHRQSVGLPIIFGNHRNVSRPSARLTSGGKSLRLCVVNDYSDVFVIPLLPLRRHHSYTVTVRYRGKFQSRWRFKTT